MYYAIGRSCGPYDHVLEAGGATSFTLNNPDPRQLFFVVTAYDYLDRESAFTNEVVKPSTAKEVFLPIIR